MTTQTTTKTKSTRGLHAFLKSRGAPRIFTPPKDARFVGAREGLRVYVKQDRGRSWSYYVIGPADVLLDFNGYSNEAAAERHGVTTLTKLADRILV